MSIVDNEITQGKMAEKWKPPKYDTARGLPNERMPYLIEQPNSMARIRHMYTKKGDWS